MKNMIFFLFFGLITFTSCNSDSATEDLTLAPEFAGLYSGQLNSEDDDNMDQLVFMNITKINDTSYNVDLIDDSNTLMIRTVATVSDDKLSFGRELVQTETENEVLSLEYTLQYVEDGVLDLDMVHKYDEEDIEFVTTSRMTK